jgi:alkylation response protein AidB-like acyl-CoA dehydrogenase
MWVELELSAEDLAFRDAVRAFLAANLTPELAQAGRRMTSVFCDKAHSLAWQKILHAQGWAAPDLAGGIRRSRLDRDAAPRLRRRMRPGRRAQPGADGPEDGGAGDHGVRHAAQKAHYLPRILSGEDYWCQGYSEPGAGSDLAALSLRAVGRRRLCADRLEDLDHPRPLGQPDVLPGPHLHRGPPQAGITFLLIDMDTPGISVKPIVTLAGEHEVNQVFFDEARTPVADRLGEENQGWTVAKHLLTFERGGGYAPGLEAALERLRTCAAGGRRRDRAPARRPASSPPPGRGRDRGPGHRHLRAAGAQRPGRRRRKPGPASSLLKLQGSEASSAWTNWADTLGPMSPRTSPRRARPARTCRRSAPSTA